MKICFTFLLVLFSIMVKAQIPLNLEGEIVKKIPLTKLDVGTKIKIKEITNTAAGSGFYYVNIESEKGNNEINSSYLDEIKYDIKNLEDFWKVQSIKQGVYDNILSKGFQYDLRKDLDNEALHYLDYLEKNNFIFEDEFIESYLYSLIYKIYPLQINDGRPGILNVKILKNNSPNAFAFANGTLLVTTGLLSTINSEQELIAILAHEVSHFVLDHSVLNINKEAQRKKAAEFWSTFLTGIAAGTEIYLTSKDANYAPGYLTLGTAVLSYSIASDINERLGLEYSREQESAADECAVKLLKQINITPNALATALNKIKNYSILTGNYYALSGKGTHPNIDERIKKIGVPEDFTDIVYDKKLSSILTYNAKIELQDKHFLACRNLIDRNIKANVATEDDLILKAKTNLYLYDSDVKNKEALDLINRAKSLNVNPNIDAIKQEAIILLRLNKKTEAITAFESYSNKLLDAQKNLDKIQNQSLWLYQASLIYGELDWTKTMIYKTKNL